MKVLRILAFLDQYFYVAFKILQKIKTTPRLVSDFSMLLSNFKILFDKVLHVGSVQCLTFTKLSKMVSLRPRISFGRDGQIKPTWLFLHPKHS